MIRRKSRDDSAPNHERWLVSYADFITLMFAFFVVLFASSQADQARTKAVSDAVAKALKDENFAARLMHVLGGNLNSKKEAGNATLRGLRDSRPNKEGRPDEKMAELAPSVKQLTAELADDIKAGRLQIHLEPRGLVISLKEGAFFASGDDTVSSERYGSIAKLANVIKSLPNPVRLEGHTDSTPIRNARFTSNWALSAARSIAMLEFFRDRFGVPEQRMAIVGYGDTASMSTNETEVGRAQNRRVDITILNEAASSQEAKPFPLPNT